MLPVLVDGTRCLALCHYSSAFMMTSKASL